MTRRADGPGTKDEWNLVAYHEAGHAVMAVLLGARLVGAALNRGWAVGRLPSGWAGVANIDRTVPLPPFDDCLIDAAGLAATRIHVRRSRRGSLRMAKAVAQRDIDQMAERLAGLDWPRCIECDVLCFVGEAERQLLPVWGAVQEVAAELRRENLVSGGAVDDALWRARSIGEALRSTQPPLAAA